MKRSPHTQPSEAAAAPSEAAAAPSEPAVAAGSPAAADRTSPPQQQQQHKRTLFMVWDLDETLIIFNGLLNGRFAAANGGCDGARAAALGAAAEALLLAFLEARYSFEAVLSHDVASCADFEASPPASPSSGGGRPHKRARTDSPAAAEPADAQRGSGDGGAGALPPEARRRLAAGRAAYEAAREASSSGAAGGDDPPGWAAVFRDTEALTGGWAAAAGALLAGVSAAGEAAGVAVRHALVSASHLAAVMAKLQLYGLARHFSPNLLFSACGTPKLQCFRRLRAAALAAHPDALFCASGDGLEEEEAAARCGWPFLPVRLGPADPDASDGAVDVRAVDARGVFAFALQLGGG
jgi:hypothetical protein